MENNFAQFKNVPASRRKRGLSPSRLLILDFLDAKTQPSTIIEIAAAMELHENTVREHLHGLEKSGLVFRSQNAEATRGRPAWLWSTKAPVKPVFVPLRIRKP